MCPAGYQVVPRTSPLHAAGDSLARADSAQSIQELVKTAKGLAWLLVGAAMGVHVLVTCLNVHIIILDTGIVSKYNTI